MTSFSRRNLLRGAAGLTLALPWMESLAQTTSAPPRRLIFCFTANGDETARRMKVKSETGFVFDDMLSPFEAWRNELIVLDGMHKYHNLLPSGQRADAHQQGGSALAPWPSGSGSFPIGGSSSTIGYVMGPSADKAIGDLLLKKYPGIPYRNLIYRVGQTHNNIWNQHAHAGPEGTQAPIAPETSPFQAYSRIFQNLDTSGQEALKRRLAMRASSLDLVTEELSALKPQLAGVDRQRLDAHTETIFEIERGLMSLGSTNTAECKAVPLGSQFDVYADSNYKQVGFLFFKIAAMAFACDLTRVAQFNWSGNTNDRTYKELGLTSGHHTISHNSDATAFSQIRAIKQHLFELSCQLHTELKAIPEAGKTVWDNTLVVHWSELSQGNTHARDNDLVVLAGGAQGHFRMGRYLNMTQAPKRSFSDLLVSCFHYMGFTNVNSFGYAPLGSGAPLPNLT